MEEGNIVAWYKKEGDKVERGDLLAEIETDKATMEFESLWEGVLLHIAVKEGPVPVNGVIAVIGEEGEDWKAALEAEKEATSAAATHDSAQPTPSATQPPHLPAAGQPAPAQTAPPEQGRIKASPLARNMARQAGIDLSQIKGTGEHGRIVKRDVEAYLQQRQGPAPAPAAAPPPQGVQEPPAPQARAFASISESESWEDLPLSQMRKTIARRLSESKFTAPHFYLTVEIDMGKAIEWRKQINEVAPHKISFNDLVIKACALALRQHPAVNASWLGDKIRRYKVVHIGVAVAVDDGLLVPVVRHADMKSLSQINSEVRTLAEKARARKLQPEEMQGNTFTISNLGMFGIEEFTAIINPPDACILAVGSILEKPVVKQGTIMPAHMMKVTLSCDHRVVDGATGAQFLQTLKGILENPIRLLV